MNQETVIYLGQQAMWITLVLSAPMLIAGMVIGLIIGLFQSVTQVQEITLTFVPKILVVMITFALFMPFMIATVLAFTTEMFGGVEALIQ